MINKICLICEKPFRVPPSHGISKYCSSHCYGVSKKGIRPSTFKKVQLNCCICNNLFLVSPYRKQIAKYCSKECRIISQRKKISREKNHSWKGGRYIDGYGYIRVLNKDHLYANSMGYVLEHRLIMENYLGRILARSELVHHVNGIKTDNRIENLELTDRVNHMRLHAKKRWKEVFK